MSTDLPSSGRLPALDLDLLDDERRAVADEVLAGRGRLPTPFRVWLASPLLTRQMYGLGQFLSDGVSLSKAEAEIAILVAAHRCGAEYVVAVHAREAETAGLDSDAVAALCEGRAPTFADRRRAAVAALMAAVFEPGTPSQEVLDEASAAVGSDGVAELLAMAGYFTAVGLATKLYAVPPPRAEGGSR